MTTWIKFSERQPEKEGDYLYSEDGELFRVLAWTPGEKHFWDPYSEDTSGRPNPLYWAEIMPPRVRASGISPLCRDQKTIKDLQDILGKERSMPEQPLCKDCKWIAPALLHPHPVCDHPKAKHSLVDGNPVQRCENLRETYCDHNGSWFEAKGTPFKPRPCVTIGLTTEERADYIDVLDKIRQWFQ